MNLDKYIELTGLNVPSSKEAYMTAQIKRATSKLETMLGFTLDPAQTQTNLYNELGKTTNECACPNVDTEDLLDPDEVVGAYRLYEYERNDEFFFVDPFTKINAVKLVYLKQGYDNSGVTLKTFTDNEIRVDGGRMDLKKYIQHCQDCLCFCECDYSCIQLAVDGCWLWREGMDIPDELLYILCDMVTWYSDPKSNIKSESITSHSYTKFDNIAPEDKSNAMSVIKKYAGPNGSVISIPTISAKGRRNGNTIRL